MIQNSDKFLFGERRIDFCGFDVSDQGIAPNKDTSRTILDFPSSKDITGVCSWIGLINQVPYAFCHTSKLEPFREQLQHKKSFAWSDILE